MLDIELRLPIDGSGQVATTLYGIREAMVANLVISFDGRFTLLPLGMESQFGPSATGRITHGSRQPRVFGPSLGPITPIDTGVRQKLQDMWPKVKEKMQDPSHYLSLPLRRLIDGRGRTRLDDQVMDYSIGLASMLSEPLKERTEIRYKFSLRGATISAENGLDKQEAFLEFRKLYDIRSAIAHGRSISNSDLHTNSSNGERLLRMVWEWHLAQGLQLQGAIARLDRRIQSA